MFLEKKASGMNPKKVTKLALNSQLLTVQILTNHVQVLILCLSYFITTVLDTIWTSYSYFAFFNHNFNHDFNHNCIEPSSTSINLFCRHLLPSAGSSASTFCLSSQSQSL